MIAKTRLRLLAIVLVAALPVAALAALAKLYLKNGVVLRGDVTESDGQILLKNAAGEARYSRDEIERIEYLEPAASQPTSSAPASERSATSASRPSSHAASREGVPPPPPLSKRDIQRLKLHELPLDGEAEKVNVQFTRAKAELVLDEQVRKEIEKSPDADPEWDSILRRGTPAEKLQVILKATGLKYADRIDVKSDPLVFDVFRKRILPEVTKGCLRSGCHGGNVAVTFRFPLGAQNTDEYVYSAFYILDQTQSPYGPLLNRALPEQSVLLKYLMPAPKDGPAHPPTTNGRVMPVIRSREERLYQEVLDWLSSLRVQRDYDLLYDAPLWLRELARTPPAPPASQPATKPAKPPASRPTSRPATKPAAKP